MGTRQRAAVGISEVSGQSLQYIVSEGNRRNYRLARQDGKIIRHLDPRGDLEMILTVLREEERTEYEV